MKKFSLIFALLITGFTFSQNRIEDFQVTLPETKVPNSLYKTLKLVDARIDSTNMGIVQKGAFNAKAKVVPTVSLRKQLQSVLDAQNGTDAQNGEMLLYLKQFSFAEVTGAVSEKGYCYVQGFLFGKNADGTYSPLDKIDQVILHSSLDVTKATMKKGSEMISNFIAKNATKTPATADKYTYAEIKNYDQIVKGKYPLYANSTLTDGLYTGFESFRNQIPASETFTSVKFGPDNSKIIKIYTNQTGKDKEIQKDQYYALIDKGIPYIYSDLDNGFLKMNRGEGNELYYQARAKATAKTGNVVMASAFFGIIGGLIASDTSAKFDMKLDYLNGAPIPIREVKK